MEHINAKVVLLKYISSSTLQELDQSDITFEGAEVNGSETILFILHIDEVFDLLWSQVSFGPVQ